MKDYEEKSIMYGISSDDVANNNGIGSGKTLQDIPVNEERRRLYYYTALYSDTDGEIALREYEINGNSGDLANWQPTGNWWNIDYSVNKVSETRFTP